MQAASTRPRRAAKAVTAKRDIILEAATALFLEVGYGDASINELVSRVGGSKATVYAHFDNKEGLFEAVVDGLLQELSFAAVHGLRDGIGLREGLTEMGKSLLGLVMSERHISLARVVIAEAKRFPALGRIYFEHGPAMARRGIVDFLARHLSGDRAKAEEAASWFYSRLLHRWFIERLCRPEFKPKPAAIEQEVAATVEGLLRLYGGGQGEAGCA
ncbi:MAG: TetR/AcrR family transcriptional regulator [Sphingomonadales bacterium]